MHCMKVAKGLLIAAFCLLSGPGNATTTGAATSIAKLSKGVDLILTQGQIRTGGGWVEAIAVSRGVIVAIGSATDIEKLRNHKTRVINLHGDTVLPGLHDLHVHPLFGGLMQSQCWFMQGLTLSKIQASVKSCAKGKSAGEWIMGGQWDASAIGSIPTRAMLDAVVADRPVLLSDTSGHSAWVNSRALQIAGINKQTPNPPGGIIERDAAGEPSGILREGAIALVRSKAPKPSAEKLDAALAWSLKTMLSYGITSFTEAAIGFNAGAEAEMRAYAHMADRGLLKQHARLCLTWGAADNESDQVVASRNLFARDQLRTDCVKIFLDGVPTDSHTAAMIDPYIGGVDSRADDASQKGMLLVDQRTLDDAVTRFDRMGLTVKFHSAGDAAVRAGLNAIAAARQSNGLSGPRHDVGHCTFVALEDIRRGRDINATFDISPYLWSPSPINDTIAEAVGQSRAERSWPARSMLESGALVVAGSDWAVVPSVNPWIGIEQLVTRERPGGSDQSFGKAEAISVEQALDLFTVNAARHNGIADKVGRIEAGMQADLIVVDQNPYKVPDRQLHKTKVKMTFIAGEKVFDAATKNPSP